MTSAVIWLYFNLRELILLIYLLSYTEKLRSKNGKKKGKPVTRIDHLYLSMTFHRLMAAGLALIPDCLGLLKTEAKGLVIGLGGGGLPMFLYKQFPKVSICCVLENKLF